MSPSSTSSSSTSESDLILQALVSSMPVVTFLLDQNGIIKRLQASNLDAFGPKAHLLVGRSIYSVYHDQPEIVLECERALRGEKFASTIELVGFVFNVWFTPIFEDDGSVSGVIGIAQDITEQKRAEDLLQQQANLLYSVSDALIATDANLVIESWNYAAESMYGWREDEVIGLPLTDILNLSQTTEPDQNIVEMTLRHGMWRGELLLNRRDGQPISVLAAFSLVDHHDGSPAAMIAVFHDITERKHAEERMLQLSIEKEKINMLKDFIADASHDLRTPITTIQTSAYLLRRKNPTLESVNLDTIELQAAHLGRLVDDLVTLSRLDADTQQYVGDVHLNELIEKLCSSFQATASKGQQMLSFEPDRRVGVVAADEIAIQRAITNLIANAINYTPTQGRILVRTRWLVDKVAVDVEDSGIGIAPEDLEKVFDRFYRVKKSRPTENGGTGLGLAITKKIAETHGGEVRVKSELDHGSTFTLLLPIHGPQK